MEQKKFRIFGERILVERILEKASPLDKTPTLFKNKVKVLAIGEDLDTKIKEEDVVLIVGGTMDIEGESYIQDSQILRWV